MIIVGVGESLCKPDVPLALYRHDAFPNDLYISFNECRSALAYITRHGDSLPPKLQARVVVFEPYARISGKDSGQMSEDAFLARLAGYDYEGLACSFRFKGKKRSKALDELVDFLRSHISHLQDD